MRDITINTRPRNGDLVPYKSGKFTTVYFADKFARVLDHYDYSETLSLEDNESIVADIIHNAKVWDGITLIPYVEEATQ